MLTKEQLNKILIENDLNGFSVAVKGELKRYVVANTHNDFVNLDETNIALLLKQVNENMYAFDNVTVWGWRDMGTGVTYIDAWMSTDDLEYAKLTGRYTNQKAIWDTLEEKEIYL